METKSHWAHIQEVSFIAGMKFLFWIYRLLGRIPFRVALYPVVIFYLISQTAARHASKHYLQNINIKPTLLHNLQHFISFSESILDKMLLWGGLFKLNRIQFHGREYILDNLTHARGGLLICSHLGNIELCRLLSKQNPNLKLTVLMHTKHAKHFNQLLAQLDPASQLNILQVTEMSPATAILLKEKVDQGEFIVIAGDRIPVSLHPRVTVVPFLGKNAPFPIGPYILASLLQCPIYLMFALRTQQGAEIYFEPFTENIQLPRKNRDKLLTQFAAHYAARLGYYCHKAPFQWFNFYEFWGE